MAKEANLLIFDDGVLLREHRAIFEEFALYRYNSVTEKTLHNISEMLISSKSDMVLVYTSRALDALQISRAVRNFDESIALFVILESLEHSATKEIINSADAFLVAPFESSELYKKMSTTLAQKFTSYNLSEVMDAQNNTLSESEDVSVFAQYYKQDATVIIEQIANLRERLINGELGHLFFCEIADEIDAIGRLFAKHSKTAHIKSIFDEMSAFLRIYDFDEVEVATLVGFDYLVAILEDISEYIESFFVQETFLDVYVFEASLRDTIMFMVRRLTNQDEQVKRDDDVEFF